MRPSLLPPLAMLLLALSACGKRDPAPAPPAQGTTVTAASSSSSPAPQSDPWVGRWTGPEGTFLEVAASAGGYQLTLHNLDGPRQFQGKPVGDAIVFERNGVPEAIRKGTGAQTGMKWLAEKSDCLVVGPGEGYCRG
jgi:predicted small lipoprotein YifL